jgi:DNA-binding MurR/RpiR family transcriptional regulator
MHELDKLKQRIKENIASMTESQKHVVNYILENPRLFALSSVRDLEKELNTSKATIVRVAQSLGYTGFQDLRSELLKNVRNELDPLHRFKSILDESNYSREILNQVAEQTIININQTVSTIPQSDFYRGIELIKKAEHVYTFGYAMSTYLAEITAYMLSRVSIKAHALTYGGLSYAEQIINMSEKDLIIAFSFPPYTETTIKAAEYAKEKNLTIISFTDKPTSAIVQYSDLVFPVAVESVTMSNSIMSTIVYIYSLVAQIGRDLKEKTIQTIESIDHVRKEH